MSMFLAIQTLVGGFACVLWITSQDRKKALPVYLCVVCMLSGGMSLGRIMGERDAKVASVSLEQLTPGQMATKLEETASKLVEQLQVGDMVKLRDENQTLVYEETVDGSFAFHFLSTGKRVQLSRRDLVDSIDEVIKLDRLPAKAGS